MNKTISFASTLVLTLLIAGCGNNNSANSGKVAEAASPNSSESTAAAADPAKVTKIVVGTGTAFPNVCFIDENGKLTGFDVELLKEIDKRLPEYEFEFQTMDFSNLLLSLETKKIDLVAHVMEKNPEREQKYAFNKEAYAHWRNRIVVAKGNTSIQTLDDLQGKKVLTGATSAQAQILENYNKEHGADSIKIVYQNGAANDTVNQIDSGRVDALPLLRISYCRSLTRRASCRRWVPSCPLLIFYMCCARMMPLRRSCRRPLTEWSRS